MRILFLAIMGLLLFASCSDDTDSQVSQDMENTLFTSNNFDGNIRYFGVDGEGTINSTVEVASKSSAADGVFYDEDMDLIIQASRTDLGIDVITEISSSIIDGTINSDFFSANNLKSPRETAVTDDYIVVADSEDVDGDASTLDGRFFIFSRNGESVTLRNIVTTDFKVWGIQMVGDDLYAVVDLDDELAIFNDFLDNDEDVTLRADKRVVIEGITRTHGLNYDEDSNTMVMTDIGAASNTQDDGALHIIQDFDDLFEETPNGGMIALSDQIRIVGNATLLGNPVDVAYDGENEIVYVAEIGNGGGRLLAFKDYDNGGDIAPSLNISVASISSVYLNK